MAFDVGIACSVLVKRRTDVVGVFPNPAALLRLASAVLGEHRDEGDAGDRSYLSEASMAALCTINAPTPEPVEEVVSFPEPAAA